ncbi:efflux RND transporter periplasmic adaptor subunit [Methyloferula stellata]|uniref:efflux RND transporter periplasmic adaptor subunit n=1 Tax=Methyloferula stellata TaxID=876270 RepID=UPI00036D7C5A|nr:efflux RND transporter periplasmic adaptor subunit [Methyloferula stellata]
MSGDLWPPIDAEGNIEGAPASTAAPRRRRFGLAAFGLILAGAAIVGGYNWMNNQSTTAVAATPPAPEVTVSAPLQRQLATWTDFTGQFSAVDRVEIRAQVSGYLTEIHFTDGQIVKKGDLLFVIDQRPYQIVAQQARAQLATAQASLELANKQLTRTTELRRSDFASVELYDQRVQQLASAAAAVDQAKAAVNSAELNLEFTRITAPLSGKISTHRVSLGNLVTGGQGGATTLLTTIVSLDPIYLDFDMSENDYLAYQRFLHSPHGGGDIDRTVQVSLSDEGTWKHRGVLEFMDNEMDRSSGTIHARATLANPDFFIAPGQFARLRLPTAASADVLLVPDSAVNTDQSRKLLMTIGADGTVTPKAVEIGTLDGNLRVIKSGVTRDDKVIINGLMHARPGMKVTPKAGTITAPPDEG